MTEVVWLSARFDAGYNDAVAAQVVQLLASAGLNADWLYSDPPQLMVWVGVAHPERLRVAEQVASELRAVRLLRAVRVMVTEPEQDTGPVSPVGLPSN